MEMPSMLTCWRTALSSTSNITGAIPLLLLTTALLSTAPGCESFIYDPPPVVTLEIPSDGSFVVGSELTLRFSEAIDPESLVVRVWRTALTIEFEIPADAVPVVADCTLAQGTCGDLTMRAAEGEDPAAPWVVTMALDPAGIGRPGPPLVLEIARGLSDSQGNDTGVSKLYNVQFRADGQVLNTEPVPFVNGTYIFGSVINQPIPAVLTLISDVVVTPDGRIFIAGGEGDEIGDAPKTTLKPEELFVDPTDQGWAAHLRGYITLTADGDRLMETEPVDLHLPTDPLFVDLEQVRIVGQIIKDANGNDYIEGTMSFERVAITTGGRMRFLAGGVEPVIGVYVQPGKEPANHPLICGDLCGVIIGECSPPPDFPDVDVCAGE